MILAISQRLFLKKLHILNLLIYYTVDFFKIKNPYHSYSTAISSQYYDVFILHIFHSEIFIFSYLLKGQKKFLNFEIKKNKLVHN